MDDETRQNALRPACTDLAHYHQAIKLGGYAGSVDRRIGCEADPAGWFSVSDLPVSFLTLFSVHYMAAYRGVQVTTDAL